MSHCIWEISLKSGMVDYAGNLPRLASKMGKIQTEVERTFKIYIN